MGVKPVFQAFVILISTTGDKSFTPVPNGEETDEGIFCHDIRYRKVYNNESKLAPNAVEDLIHENHNSTHRRFFFFPSERSGLVTFWLFTRRNKFRAEELFIGEPSYYLLPDTETKVVSHGWIGDGNIETIMEMKNAYLWRYDCNFIAVDWKDLAWTFYPTATRHTFFVGKKVAEFLNGLNNWVPASKMHLIGHSLGAHVVGVAGLHVHQKVRRVTGLDPASPHFEYFKLSWEPNNKLDIRSGMFVDVIHTSTSVLGLGLGPGYTAALGHVDFYPNGGENQPGCWLFRGDLPGIVGCSHFRSLQLFTESIYSNVGFVAYPCRNYKSFKNNHCSGYQVLMGEYVSYNARGNYYLDTEENPPYARGNQGPRQELADIIWRRKAD